MTLDDALEALKSKAQPGRNLQMAAYHKVERRYLGVANPDINDLVKNWREILDVAQRVRLAGELWDTNIFEARLAAAKLLTQCKLVASGGEAKSVIAAGQVRLNGKIETQKRKKIVSGDEIEFNQQRLKICLKK